MAFVDESLRLAIGAGACVAQNSSAKKEAQLRAQTHMLTESMTEIELEWMITREVHGADYDKEMEIWTYLEIFKRNNPHLAGISDLWDLVGGEERKIFSKIRWIKERNESIHSKSAGDTLRIHKNIVIELIMNTYGTHSGLGDLRLTSGYSFYSV